MATNQKEIRIRSMEPAWVKQLNQVQQILHEKSGVIAITKLVPRFLQDQKSLADLQKRNSELHRAIKGYYDKEDRMLQIIRAMEETIDTYLSDMKVCSKAVKGMKKHYGTKRPGARRS